MVDALGGTLIDLEPETLKGLMPDSSRFDPHHERHSQFRYPGTSDSEFQTKRSVGTIQLEDNLLLVLEDTEALAFESEPVFWMD